MILYIWLGKVDLGGSKSMKARQRQAAFYLAVVVIVVVAVFPFYYAIITSFKTGTALFQVNYWPTEFNFGNYIDVMRQGSSRATS